MRFLTPNSGLFPSTNLGHSIANIKLQISFKKERWLILIQYPQFEGPDPPFKVFCVCFDGNGRPSISLMRYTVPTINVCFRFKSTMAFRMEVHLRVSGPFFRSAGPLISFLNIILFVVYERSAQTDIFRPKKPSSTPIHPFDPSEDRQVSLKVRRILACPLSEVPGCTHPPQKFPPCSNGASSSNPPRTVTPSHLVVT